MALARNRNTAERIPALRQFAAQSAIYAGALVAINADNKAVPAADTAGLKVVGVAQNQVSAGGLVTVKSGCFRFKNAASSGVDNAAAGTVCYIKDDETVCASGMINSIKAGVVYEVTSKGIWVIIGDGVSTVAAHDHVLGDISDLTAAAAITDVSEAGEASANLITAVNGILAALRTNGIITA